MQFQNTIAEVYFVLLFAFFLNIILTARNFEMQWKKCDSSSLYSFAFPPKKICLWYSHFGLIYFYEFPKVELVLK